MSNLRGEGIERKWRFYLMFCYSMVWVRSKRRKILKIATKCTTTSWWRECSTYWRRSWWEVNSRYKWWTVECEIKVPLVSTGWLIILKISAWLRATTIIPLSGVIRITLHFKHAISSTSILHWMQNHPKSMKT